MIKIQYNYKDGLVSIDGLSGCIMPTVYIDDCKVEYVPYCHGISHSFDFGEAHSNNIIFGEGYCHIRSEYAKKVLDIFEKALLHWNLDYEINFEPRRQVLFEKGKAKACV